MARDCRCPTRERHYEDSEHQDKYSQTNLSLVLTAVIDESHLMNDFLIDSGYSGCTHHMTGSKTNFTEYNDFENTRMISTFGGVKGQGVGCGSLRFNHDGHIFNLEEVIYVPGTKKNLFSCIAANQSRNQNLFNLDHCAIIKDNKMIKLKVQKN